MLNLGPCDRIHGKVGSGSLERRIWSRDRSMEGWNWEIGTESIFACKRELAGSDAMTRKSSVDRVKDGA